MTFEKRPAGGGAGGWIRNSTKSARLRFHCRPINRGKVSLQAAHTEAPCENCRQLPSAAISYFLRTRPWHQQKTEQQKNCLSEKDVDQVLYSTMDGRRSQNKQHSDTVPPKARDVFLCSLQMNIKKRARRGSVLRDTCGLPDQNEISTQLYEIKNVYHNYKWIRKKHYKIYKI